MTQTAALIFAIEVVAVLAGAFSGFAEAQRKKVDAVGIFTVAFVTAFGGGTLRDLLIDRRPFFWVQHQNYVILIVLMSLIATPLLRLAHRIVPNWAFVVADAIGLGFFSVSGVALAMAAGMPLFIASLMGVVTGIFGGILRDVILNEVPLVLRDGQPYALAAFFGSWFYILMLAAGADAALALWLAAATTTAVRLIAWKYDWTIT